MNAGGSRRSVPMTPRIRVGCLDGSLRNKRRQVVIVQQVGAHDDVRGWQRLLPTQIEHLRGHTLDVVDSARLVGRPRASADKSVAITRERQQAAASEHRPFHNLAHTVFLVLEES